MKKFPPIEKVFEAWTAIADQRIAIHNGYADIKSSDGEKTYIVRFRDDKYSSDDNATYWQGYPGYPVIAVLMLQNRLPYNTQEAELWKNINWTSLNKKYKNNYAKAVEEIATERGIDLTKSMGEAEKVMESLKVLPIEIKRKI